MIGKGNCRMVDNSERRTTLDIIETSSKRKSRKSQNGGFCGTIRCRWARPCTPSTSTILKKKNFAFFSMKRGGGI
jgi:hypothetical protein